MTNYPGALDPEFRVPAKPRTTKLRDSNGGSANVPDMLDDLGQAMNAVQAELGVDPSASFATVRARLDAGTILSIEGEWTAQAYTPGALVTHEVDEELLAFIAREPTGPGDEPGASPKWVDFPISVDALARALLQLKPNRVLDAAVPTLVGEVVDNDLLGNHRDIKFVGGYAISLSLFEGLSTWDISDPTAPVNVGFVAIDGAYRMSVSGRYAYVSARSFNRLLTVDLQNMANPTIVSEFRLATGANLKVTSASKISGRYLFLTHGGDNREGEPRRGGLVICDLALPQAPRIVTILEADDVGPTGEILGDPHEIDIDGHYAYIASPRTNSMEIFDISDAPNTQLVSWIKTADGGDLDTLISVAASDGYAYVACTRGPGDTGSVRVIDCTDPSDPTLRGGIVHEDFFERVRSVRKYGRYMTFIVNPELDPEESGIGNINIADITDPDDPQIVAAVGVPDGNRREHEVYGGYIWLVQSNRIRVFDLFGVDFPTGRFGAVQADHVRAQRLEVDSGAVFRGGVHVTGGVAAREMSAETAATDVHRVGHRLEVAGAFVPLAWDPTVPRHHNRVLAGSPVAYWRLNESSEHAQDHSGNGHHSNLSEGVTYGVAGPLTDGATAVSFAGGSPNRIRIPHDAALNPGLGDFSWGLWARTTDLTAAQTLYFKADAVVRLGIRIGITSAGLLQVLIQDAGGSNVINLQADAGFGDGDWHRILVALDRSGDIVAMADGQIIASASAAPLSSLNLNSGSNVILGAGNASGTATPFNGDLASVALYPRVVTPVEEQTLYLAGLGGQVTVDRDDIQAMIDDAIAAL